MSTTNDIGQTVAASAASAVATAKSATYGGGAVSIVGFFASNEGLAAIGAAFALLGFIANFYFGWRDDRRKQLAHEASEEERRERLRLMREDRG